MKINYLEITGFKNTKETKRFDFGLRNHILGDNGEGKTSIGEAIVFCILGTSLNSEVRRNDDLINIDSKEAIVEINLRDDYGNIHTIIRIKDRQNQRIILNGNEEATQSDINNIIGSSNFFLSMFSLSYFHEILDDTERRALFLQYSPKIDMVRLFREFAEESLINKYEIQIHQPNDYKRLNKMRGDTERFILESKHEIQILQQQDSSETATKKQLENERKVELAKIDSAIKATQEKLSGLCIKPMIALKNDKTYLEYSRQFASVSFMTEPHFADMSNSASCPVCYAALSEEHKNHIISYQNSEIERVREHNKKVEQVRQIIMQRQQQRIVEIEEYNKEVYEINNEQQRLINELERLANLQVQFSSSANPFETQQNQRKHRLAYLNKNIAELQTQYEELEAVCAAMSPTLGIFRKAVEVKADYLKREFSRCSVILERTKKNGETQECFDIFFDNKPYRRLSYSEKMLCSMEIAKFLRTKGEKNVPLFIDNAESISKIPPELVEDIEQLFMCVVVKDKALSCTVAK